MIKYLIFLFEAISVVLWSIFSFKNWSHFITGLVAIILLSQLLHKLLNAR